MVEALLGLGGNLGAARTTLERAIGALCDGDSIKLMARSSDYRTLAWGVTDQPPFVNVCIAVETGLTPRELLERGLAVERSFGRNRATEQRWGPRTLDIDILTYGDLTIDEPGLVVPHPRLFERAFVLVPLAEIRPDLVIGGRAISEVIQALDSTGIERLPPAA
jgi:2-amino-4-hydroxy-6-hydroxymethyldihydropteridine diphosphokinase